MKSWIHCAALTAVLITAVSGCAPVETQKSCSGDNCVSDSEITHNIELEIGDRAELSGWTITVQTIDGVVYLHGLVDTTPQRDRVEAIARDTRGVKGVQNSIELRNAR
ncbi:MAG: BON domain-containing protein [Rudaea sp.]